MEHPTSCLPMMIQDIAYSAPGMKLITNAPHIDAQRDVSPSSPEEFAPCLGHNGSQVATGIRSLSSVEDTLAREFFDSIIIFRSSVDKVSGCITTSDSSEAAQPNASKFHKKSLAIRRGIPKPLDLSLPVQSFDFGDTEAEEPEGALELQGGRKEIPPITPLDQMIPNPIMPPPAPKLRQSSILTIKERRLSSTSVNTNVPRSGLFGSPTSIAHKPANNLKSHLATPILDMAAFLTAPRGPSCPLLSPIRLAPDYPVYRPKTSPLDSDFDLYGAMPNL